MKQSSLWQEGFEREIRTVVISQRRDFDQLFEGFTSLRAISYVSSATILIDFLNRRGFEAVELLVGETISSKQIKDDLSKEEPSIIEKLAEEVERGRLKILVPKRTVHSKFYILNSGDQYRLIVTSANLTESARQASRQINYAWYLDISKGNPMLQRAERDYRKQCEGASLFMGDLLDLLMKRKDLPPKEIISIWLSGEGIEDRESEEARTLIQGMVSEVFAHPGQEEQSLIRINLPAASGARRKVAKMLAPMGIEERGPEARTSPAKVIRYVEEAHGVPLMRVDMNRGELWMGFRGAIKRVDKPLGSPEEVDVGLRRIEEYIDTVDMGQCRDPLYAKICMYEALLYLMSSPFSNELMRERRRRYGIVNRRGPRFLFIYGPAQNGKTTFLRYGLLLITGSLIDPLEPTRFTKQHIRSVQILGTSFPLMFDDLTSTTTKTFEKIVKSFWEVDWNEEAIFPQIVFTSNSLNLRDWAKSRMKRVDFDVHFVPSTKTQERLARILEKPNPLFSWVSNLYLERIQGDDWLTDDELSITREIMKGLYRHANRSIPKFFPEIPLDELYDPNLRTWNDLIRQRQVSFRREREQTLVVFSDDLEHEEIREHQAALPQTVKARRSGKTIAIENPEVFHAWLDGSHGGMRWWQRLLRREG
jgi:hypothetical protein